MSQKNFFKNVSEDIPEWVKNDRFYNINSLNHLSYR